MKQESNIEWRDIPGYEGRYQVSSTGQVYSLISNIEMKQVKVSSGGHLAVMLYLNGIGKMRAVHFLVAQAFIGPRLPNYYTHHKNEIKNDNRADNLEYMLASEHTSHHVRGEKHARARLTESDVKKIRELARSGEDRKNLSLMFGITPSTVGQVIRKTKWKHIT